MQIYVLPSMRISGPPSAQVVLLLQRRDESLSPDLIEQGRVDVILDLGADAGELRDGVLGADRLDIERRLQLVITVADRGQLRIGDLELLRQHLLRPLLIGEREVIALDSPAQKSLEPVAIGRGRA